MIHGCCLTAVKHSGIPPSNILFSDCQSRSLYERHESNTDVEGYIAKLCLHSPAYAADHKGTVCVLWGEVIVRNVRQDCNYGRAQS